MEVQSFFSVSLFLILVFKLDPIAAQSAVTDADILNFALTLEYLEGEFYFNGANGRGLDEMTPNLARGGPPPTSGARKANLNPQVLKIIEEFSYHKNGHIRSIRKLVGGFARPPVLNLSKEVFGKIFDVAVGFNLNPSLDPYANTTNYLLAAYMFPYLVLGFYVGAIPLLVFPQSRMLAASLLGVAAGHDAVIRTLLYEVANDTVYPYDLTVANFTNLISSCFNQLAGGYGVKHEGLTVPLFLGAENKTTSNILSADVNSLSYAQTPQEVLRILYGTGNESVPGGFFPKGASGKIARRLLL